MLLLVVDTLRADILGVYGGDERTSPRLERLAQAGVVFEDCRASSPWTLPSMASIFTGRYPRSHGAALQGIERSLKPMNVPNRLPAEITSLPRLFRTHGYETFMRATNPYLGFGLDDDFEHKLLLQSHAGRVVDWGIEQLAARDTTRPFFMLLHFIDVHAPNKVGTNHGEEALAAFQREGKARLRASHRDFKFLRTIEGERKRQAYIEARRLMYSAAVRFVDGELGRLRDHFAANDPGPTIWAYTSDHGEEFYEHFEVDKEAGYNDPRLDWKEPLSYGHGHHVHSNLTHVPLILAGPGVPEGLRVAGRVGLVDVLPTLAELAGLPQPPGVQGRSLVALMHGDDQALPYLSESLAYGREKTAFYGTDGWVLIQPQSDLERPLLYDLNNDPHETTDLYAQRPEKVRELERAQEAFSAGLELRVGESIEVSEETLRQLEALGYAGDLGYGEGDADDDE